MITLLLIVKVLLALMAGLFIVIFIVICIDINANPEAWKKEREEWIADQREEARQRRFRESLSEYKRNQKK